MSVLHWTTRLQDGPVGPLCRVDDLTDERFAVDVAEDQVALVVRDHELVKILPPDRHAVALNHIRSDERDADVQAIVQNSDSILFLRVCGLPSYEWTVDMPTGRVGGSFRIEVSHPHQMYEAFLRHTEELTCETFYRVVTAIVEGAAIERLEHAPGSTLTSSDLRHELEPRLASLGLLLNRFEFSIEERVAPPTTRERVGP